MFEYIARQSYIDFISKPPSLPLDPQGQKKRKILQGRQRNQRVLRSGIHQKRSFITDFGRLWKAPKRMVELHFWQLLLGHDSNCQKNSHSKMDCSGAFDELRYCETWSLQQIFHEREGQHVGGWLISEECVWQEKVPLRPDFGGGKEEIRGVREQHKREDARRGCPRRSAIRLQEVLRWNWSMILYFMNLILHLS